ncbi:unnamed protein product [Arctogadus glacialis]
MTGLPVGSLPSSMSSAAGVARDGAAGERERSEELDELVPLDRLASGGDFRGKFRKIRPRKRPTILERLHLVIVEVPYISMARWTWALDK